MCNGCIMQVLKKLTNIDVSVLSYLSDKTFAQTGESRAQILKTSGINASSFQIAQALMRLEIVGLINTVKSGKRENHYITTAGLKALDTLR